MTMKKSEAPEIVRVAEDIERELAALEAASRSASNLRLHDERSLEKAGKALQEGLQQQESLSAALQSLAQAMGRMQQRQQVAIDRLSVRAQEVQAQMQCLSEHMARFGELGTKAAEVTRILQSLPAPYGQGPAQPDVGPPAELMQVDVLLSAVSADAKQLVASATEADLSDIAREAGALRQRIDAARAQLARLAQARVAAVDTTDRSSN
jgi:hypothetical protein